MFQQDLAETLIELVRGVIPDPDSGVVVTEATLDLPLEIRVAESKGQLRFLGQVPHSRWKSGFLPGTHLTHLEIVLAEEDSRAR